MATLPADIPFSRWLDYLFGREVGPSGFRESDDWWNEQENPGLAVGCLTRLFEDLDALPERYPHDQLDRGFWFLLGESGHLRPLLAAPVPWPERRRGLLAIGRLFERLFAPHCANYLGHLDRGPDLPIVRPARRLAVHRHHLPARAAECPIVARLAGDRAHPLQETPPQLVRIEQPEHPPNVSCDGIPFGSARNVRSRLLRFPERRHRHPVVRPADHRARRDRQDVHQQAVLTLLGPRILQRRSMLADARRRQRHHRVLQRRRAAPDHASR
jgi:hypothetical protein